jgi:ABC-type transporter Mla MlaB component
MEVTTKNNKMIISGQVKTMEHYKYIKDRLNKLLQDKTNEIEVEITDSMSLPSSVLGLFLKTVHQDNIKISLIVHNENLITLLNELNLTNQFEIILEQ